MNTKSIAKAMLASLGLAACLLHAQTVKPLLARTLTGIEGKEGQLVEVTLRPGESGTVHRHPAQVFVKHLGTAVSVPS